MQNWDSQLPNCMQEKLCLLLERRKSLYEQQQELDKKQLLLKHKNSLNKLQNQNQQTVDTLLEHEKSELIEILDQELLQQNSRRHSTQRMPTLEQSAISFQEQSVIFHKTNKTVQSASTNASGFNTVSPQRLTKFKIDNNNNNSSHILDQENLIKQLQIQLADQQEKNIQQNINIQNLQEKNQSLQRQLEISEKNYLKFQKQTILFKENLTEKLNIYAKKLDILNTNEETIIKMQKENTRLKQEKEELVLQLRNYRC